MEHQRNATDMRRPKSSENTLSTRTAMCTGLGSKAGRRSETPATKRLSHGTDQFHSDLF
jgi:hypothetical protein